MKVTETTVWMRVDDEEPVAVHVKVGPTEPDPMSERGDMRTGVSLLPVIGHRWVHGVDSFQSLSLAVHCVIATLRALQRKGNSFSLEKDGTPMPDFLETLTGAGWQALEREIAD